VADEEAIESEKYQADVADLSIQFEKHERHRLQLFHLEYAQVLRTSQDDQGGKLKEAAKSPNGAPHEAEGRREQRGAPVHRLQHVIAKQRHSYIAHEHDEISGATQMVQRLGRQSIVRRCCGVPTYNKPATNEEGGHSRQYGREGGSNQATYFYPYESASGPAAE
jgi:hypothetical protein